MKATKQEQEMISEMVADMVADSKWNPVTTRPDFAKFIFQLMNKGYSPMFKMQKSIVDKMQEDNPWIKFVEMEESKWYLRLEHHKMSAEDAKDLEKYYSFNGNPDTLVKELSSFNSRYIFKDENGNAKRVDEDLLYSEVLNFTDFETRKQKALDFIANLDIGNNQKSKHSKDVKDIGSNEELKEYMFNFIGSGGDEY